MPVTVKVNGSSNSIVHKGSTGIAKSTAPDVCKTPSPAGPVPIPYPIIVSMSSDLANGSTTVKADGQMIGVKDCEFSMCTGDEAGTAGGVVSSTFKKEAKFILFSFDVKIDGKNACRLGDKMTMNHQNTICMSGETQAPVVPQPFVVNIDCEKKVAEKGWTKCMCKEYCAKVEKMEEARKSNGLNKSPGARKKKEYASTKKTFIASFEAKAAAKESVRDQFLHPCAADAYEAMDPKPANPTQGGKAAPYNADHTHEAAWGGALDSVANLKMVSGPVNNDISFQAYRPGGVGDEKNKGQPIVAHPACNCPDGPAGAK